MALDNTDKAPCLYLCCTIYRGIVYPGVPPYFFQDVHSVAVKRINFNEERREENGM